MKPCGSKPSSPAPCPPWKISRPTPEGGTDREQVGEDAEGCEQRRLQGDQQEEEAEDEHDADHERRLGRQCLLEVVVLGSSTTDERTRGKGCAEPVDRAADAAARRVGGRDRLHEHEPVCALLRRRDAGDPGVAAGDRAGTDSGRSRCDDLERAGRADAEGLLYLGVADARAVGGWDDLDRGHAGLEAEDRQGEQNQDDRGGGAVDVRFAPEAFAPGCEACGAVLAGMHPARRERVHLRAEPAQYHGEQRHRCGEHEGDAEHDPERHRAEGGAGDEHHRGEETKTVRTRKEDGFSCGVHRDCDRVAHGELRAEVGAAEAMDDKERVIDPEREREHEREVHCPDRDLEAVCEQREQPGRSEQPEDGQHQRQPGRDERPECDREDRQRDRPGIRAPTSSSPCGSRCEFDPRAEAPVRLTEIAGVARACSLPFRLSAAATIAVGSPRAPATTMAV